jgi:hypothetical protein
MYTIWFCNYEMSTPNVWLKVEVDTFGGMERAQEVWDKLKKGGFHMRSARP